MNVFQSIFEFFYLRNRNFTAIILQENQLKISANLKCVIIRQFVNFFQDFLNQFHFALFFFIKTFSGRLTAKKSVKGANQVPSHIFDSKFAFSRSGFFVIVFLVIAVLVLGRADTESTSMNLFGIHGLDGLLNFFF